MKQHILLIVSILAFISFFQIEARAEDYSPVQQAFFEECSTQNTTNWFYDCTCAAETAGEVIVEDQTERYDKLLKTATTYCEGEGHARGKPTKNHLDVNDTKTYDDPCELMEVLKGYQPGMVTPMRTDGLWLKFSSMNKCKNEEGIRQNALNSCPLQKEEACACYADQMVQFWLSYTKGYSSRAAVSGGSQAMTACRNK